MPKYKKSKCSKCGVEILIRKGGVPLCVACFKQAKLKAIRATEHVVISHG